MFEKLTDFLIQCIGIFQFWKVVEQWERGLVLRFGRYHRMVKPGLVFVWPFYIESVYVEDIYRKVAALPPQSLTTSEGVSVVVSAVVTYRVKNVKKVILAAGGHEDAIIAVIPGTIGAFVSGARWDDLNTEEFRSTVASAAHESAVDWGMVVEDVRFANLVKARSYRLFNENNHV